MSRPMSYAMALALKSRAPLLLLAEMEHPDGTGYFWSGQGLLDWNGQSWRGAGALGSIAPIEHSSVIAIQELKFTLAGADPDVVAQLSDDIRNRAGRAWLACLDEYGKVVADPMQIVDSQLDYQAFKLEDDGTATVQITGRSGFFMLERALDDVWSDEDHKTRFPTDSGLSLIASLQNQQLVWGPAV